MTNEEKNEEMARSYIEETLKAISERNLENLTKYLEVVEKLDKEGYHALKYLLERLKLFETKHNTYAVNIHGTTFHNISNFESNKHFVEGTTPLHMYEINLDKDKLSFNGEITNKDQELVPNNVNFDSNYNQYQQHCKKEQNNGDNYDTTRTVIKNLPQKLDFDAVVHCGEAKYFYPEDKIVQLMHQLDVLKVCHSSGHIINKLENSVQSSTGLEYKTREKDQSSSNHKTEEKSESTRYKPIDNKESTDESKYMSFIIKIQQSKEYRKKIAARYLKIAQNFFFNGEIMEMERYLAKHVRILHDTAPIAMSIRNFVSTSDEISKNINVAYENTDMNNKRNYVTETENLNKNNIFDHNISSSKNFNSKNIDFIEQQSQTNINVLHEPKIMENKNSKNISGFSSTLNENLGDGISNVHTKVKSSNESTENFDNKQEVYQITDAEKLTRLALRASKEKKLEVAKKYALRAQTLLLNPTHFIEYFNKVSRI